MKVTVANATVWVSTVGSGVADDTEKNADILCKVGHYCRSEVGKVGYIIRYYIVSCATINQCKRNMVLNKVWLTCFDKFLGKY